MKNALLFLNGQAPSANLLAKFDLKAYSLIICTDGAYGYLSELNITPDLVIGDMDSVGEIPDMIKRIHITDQNTTDFEKALYHLFSHGNLKVDILGAFGNQHDHFLGNLNAAFKFRDTLQLTFYDEEQYFYLIDKSHRFFPGRDKLVSLFPFPNCKILKSEGLKFPVNNFEMTITNHIGTRNSSILEEVEIVLESGALWLFIGY